MACQTEKHPIMQLQELCQSWKLPLPVYRECEGSYQEFGTEVTVVLDEATDADKILYKGLGRTKKASKTNVAQMAINYIAQNRPHLLERPTFSEPEVGECDMPAIWKKGEQANLQHTAPVNPAQLAKETEVLSHAHVTLDLARLIQKSRININMSQKDFAVVG